MNHGLVCYKENYFGKLWLVVRVLVCLGLQLNRAAAQITEVRKSKDGGLLLALFLCLIKQFTNFKMFHEIQCFQARLYQKLTDVSY